MSSDRTLVPARSVLVVDDDSFVRVLASRCLMAMGLTVVEAEDGPSAIRHAREAAPDLVLLDVEMPGMDGFETCAELRSLFPHRELAILIATGHTDKATIDRAFEAGASDFVHKPLDWALLQHRVRFLLRAHGAFAELHETLAELRASERRLENAQRLARIGHWEWDVDEPDMLWSAQVHEMLGVEPGPGAATLTTFLTPVHPEDREVVEKALHAAAIEAHAISLDYRIAARGGEERFIHLEVELGTPISGAPARLSGTIQDVTAQRRAEDRVRYLASFDLLTALPNRRLLMEHLQRLLGRARRRGQSLALLYLDLDRFRRINDLFDHETGDRVLQTVSDRLLSCVRSTDLVGRSELDGRVLSRLGGDEFTIVLSKMRAGDDASAAARRVLDALRQPFETPHGEVSIAASIGIAFYPGDGETPDTLLRNAKAAADAAKARGGGVWQFYRESMNESSGRLLRLEGLLDAAIERDELAVEYQPQLELSTGRIIAAEALVRWPGCELGAVGPSEFVRVAEQCGMIGRLGAWVLREVCRQVHVWREAGNPPLRISVNVSTRQLHDPDFPATVRALLAAERIEPDWLEFEITESALLVDDPAVVEAIRSLRTHGIPIALDDFGTGYSSLSHVVHLPIDVIKIDRSFVAELESQGRGAAIVAAVVALGRQLGVRVTAEGVERPAERACLEALGCDVVQGYCVSPALAPAALIEFLRERR